MAKVKYAIREFIPTANQSGGHSFYAQAQPDNVITNRELAQKIQARTGTRAYEAMTVLAAAAEIILEETAENNRVQLETGDGVSLVSIYPRVTGSISDKDVQADPEAYGNAQVATADMLTADKLQWTLGASVGKKFSKQFALNKQAERVNFKPIEGIDDDDDNTNTGTGGNTGGGNTGGGGDLTP